STIACPLPAISAADRRIGFWLDAPTIHLRPKFQLHEVKAHLQAPLPSSSATIVRVALLSRCRPSFEESPGRPSGSAMPLVWAHAEFIKLMLSRHLGYPADRPRAVWRRYQGRRPTAGYSGGPHA